MRERGQVRGKGKRRLVGLYSGPKKVEKKLNYGKMEMNKKLSLYFTEIDQLLSNVLSILKMAHSKCTTSSNKTDKCGGNKSFIVVRIKTWRQGEHFEVAALRLVWIYLFC